MGGAGTCGRVGNTKIHYPRLWTPESNVPEMPAKKKIDGRRASRRDKRRAAKKKIDEPTHKMMK